MLYMHTNFQAVNCSQIFLYFLILFVLSSCKESGNIGTGFVNESNIVIDTVFFSIPPSSKATADPYLGKLAISPVGFFNDPLFGSISAETYFKPSIINTSMSSITENHDLILRLVIDANNYYGNKSLEGEFKVFRVNEFWRGSSFQMSEDLQVLKNEINPLTIAEVGNFKLNEFDTLGITEFSLRGTWKSDFIKFFNNTEDRDSIYKYDDFGLAIVPENDVQKIIYTKFNQSKLLIISPEQDSIARDTSINTISDWAFDLEALHGSAPEENITLNNTYNPFLNLDLTHTANNIKNKNFFKAELLLTVDSTIVNESLNVNEIRTINPPFRVQIGPASDIAYSLGFNTSGVTASIDNNVYRFDITDVLNAYIYGNTEISDIFIYAAQNNGYLGFNTFFGENTVLEARPKILIYNVEESN